MKPEKPLNKALFGLQIIPKMETVGLEATINLQKLSHFLDGYKREKERKDIRLDYR